MTLMARWQSVGGKHWAELHATEGTYHYRGGEGDPYDRPSASGVIAANHDDDAMYSMRQKTKAGAGIFHPDAAKHDMVESVFYDRRS